MPFESHTPTPAYGLGGTGNAKRKNKRKKGTLGLRPRSRPDCADPASRIVLAGRIIKLILKRFIMDRYACRFPPPCIPHQIWHHQDRR